MLELIPYLINNSNVGIVFANEKLKKFLNCEKFEYIDYDKFKAEFYTMRVPEVFNFRNY